MNDAQINAAIEGADRLRTMFQAFFDACDAMKAGALDAQTVAERKLQVAALAQSIADLQAEEATLMADIEQQRREGELARKDAAAEAKKVVEDAKAEARGLLQAAERTAQEVRKHADEDAQASLSAVTAAIEAKAATLKDVSRQVDEACAALAAAQKEHATVANKIDALRASAAALLA